MPIENDYGVEARTSRWHNPTAYVRKVRICMGGQWRTVKWAPGETIELDSQYDRAVQIIICAEDECNGRGPAFTENGAVRINCQPCTRGHSGHIMGGQDPLLVRLDRGDIKNPQLDPDEVVRAAIAAEATKIAQHQQAIEAALLNANVKAAQAGAQRAADAQKPKGGQKDPKTQEATAT